MNLQKTTYAPGEDIIIEVISDNKDCMKALLDLEVTLQMKVVIKAKYIFGELKETMKKIINAQKGLPCAANNCLT